MPAAPAQHILICLHDFEKGGAERIAIGLARIWVKAGRTVTMLCGSTTGGLCHTVDPSVKVIELDPPIPQTLFSRLWLGKAMAEHFETLRPDVVFLIGNFHLFLANGMQSSALCPPIGLKISNPPLPNGPASMIAATVFRHFGKGVSGFSALSEGLARETRRIMPDKPVTVVGDPIFVNKGDGAQADILSTDRINIIWAGRLEPQKDVMLAIRTMACLQGDPRLHLTICGDGSLRQKAEKLAKQLGQQARITFAGHVSTIDPFLAKADILLMTSHYEGAPAVVGEALSHDVPVVSTDCAHFLHDVMTISAAGKIISGRNPADLAAAVLEITSSPKPEKGQLHALVAHLEPHAAAMAYLDWLDDLKIGRAHV